MNLIKNKNMEGNAMKKFSLLLIAAILGSALTIGTFKLIETDNSIYKANYYPNETGIIDLFGIDVAVNYKKEFLNLGINSDFENILKISSGTILENNPDKIIETLQRMIERNPLFKQIILRSPTWKKLLGL